MRRNYLAGCYIMREVHKRSARVELYCAVENEIRDGEACVQV